MSDFSTEYTRVKDGIALSYDKAEEKGADLPTVKNIDNLPAAIESIPAGGGGWQPHPDWFDIEKIFADDPDPNKRFIVLLSDSDNTTIIASLYLGNSTAYSKTSDGQEYNALNIFHTWDRNYDKPCSEGYKTRWIMVYSADANIACNVMSVEALYVYIGNGNVDSMGGGSSSTNNANHILQSVKCSNTVTANANAINGVGNNLFYFCTSLSSITIPNGVTIIGGSAFQNCTSLSSITIPDGVTSIEGNAFYACYSLPSITIPNGVTIIEDNAFSRCYPLTSITIPNSVTSIGNSAFIDCYSLASITIPNSVTSIGVNAFNNCASLASITIPSSVTSIGSNAFYQCLALLAFNIQEGWITPNINLSLSTKLTVSSMLDFFNKLGTTLTARTIILGTANLNKLTAQEKQIATDKGYTLA